MSKFLISYNLIKLLEQSLHAQNAVRWGELCLIFEVLCVIHREPAGGGGRGREQRKGGGFTATASGWLLLGGSFYYWPTSNSRNPVTFQSLQLSNWGTVLCFLDSTRQNSRRIAHLVALGQLAQHYIIRIVFNTLNVVNSVEPNSPHAMG